MRLEGKLSKRSLARVASVPLGGGKIKKACFRVNKGEVRPLPHLSGMVVQGELKKLANRALVSNLVELRDFAPSPRGVGVVARRDLLPGSVVCLDRFMEQSFVLSPDLGDVRRFVDRHLPGILLQSLVQTGCSRDAAKHHGHDLMVPIAVAELSIPVAPSTASLVPPFPNQRPNRSEEANKGASHRDDNANQQHYALTKTLAVNLFNAGLVGCGANAEIQPGMGQCEAGQPISVVITRPVRAQEEILISYSAPHASTMNHLTTYLLRTGQRATEEDRLRVETHVLSHVVPPTSGDPLSHPSS